MQKVCLSCLNSHLMIRQTNGRASSRYNVHKGKDLQTATRKAVIVLVSHFLIITRC